MIDTQRLIESGAKMERTPIKEVTGRWDIVLSVIQNDEPVRFKEIMDSPRYNPFALHPNTHVDMIEYMITYDAIKIFNRMLDNISEKHKNKIYKHNKYILLAIRQCCPAFIKKLLDNNPYVDSLHYNYIDANTTLLSFALEWYDPITISQEHYNRGKQIIYMLINAGILKDSKFYFSEQMNGYNIEYEMNICALARYYHHNERLIGALKC